MCEECSSVTVADADEAVHKLKVAWTKGAFFGKPTQRLAAEIALYLLSEDGYTPWEIINVQDRLRELSKRLERVKA